MRKRSSTIPLNVGDEHWEGRDLGLKLRTRTAPATTGQARIRSDGLEAAYDADSAPTLPRTDDAFSPSAFSDSAALADASSGAAVRCPSSQAPDDTGAPVADSFRTLLWQREPSKPSPDTGSLTSSLDEQYEILDKIGAGGMATVFRVRHRRLGKEFALKLIHEQTDPWSRLTELSIREAQLASRLDHPNIVQIIDFGVDPDHGTFMVMEYLRGQLLKQRMDRQTRLPLHTLLTIAEQLAEALQHMHSRGVIHGDLKAENVFLCKKPCQRGQRLSVKLIDFGLSRPWTEGVCLASDEVGGTPAYMSPELIRRQSPAPSMDLYSLGVLLYELLTGALPFEGDTNSMLRAHLAVTPLTPSELLGQPIESRVEDFVMSLLQKDPAQRPASMGEALYEMRTLIEMYDSPQTGRSSHEAIQLPAREPMASARLVESSPFPQFQVDTHGTLLFANRAFCTFVGDTEETLAGHDLKSTRLAAVYPELLQDIERCSSGQTDVIEGQFTVELDGHPDSQVRIWLIPECDEDDQVVCIDGHVQWS